MIARLGINDCGPRYLGWFRAKRGATGIHDTDPIGAVLVVEDKNLLHGFPAIKVVRSGKRFVNRLPDLTTLIIQTAQQFGRRNESAGRHFIARESPGPVCG
jgi:hypothetical protein